GIGVVETVVIYLPAQLIHVGKKQHEKSHSNTGHCLPVADLLNTARGRFGASPNDYLWSEPCHQSARAQPVEDVWLAQLQTNIKRRQRHEIYVTDLL
ncbi:MAG: hypothetical protein ACRENG_03835, partial [bacterium]